MPDSHSILPVAHFCVHGFCEPVKQEHVVLFTMHHIVADAWSSEFLSKR